MPRVKPLQALLFGAAAGAIGSFVQNVFFKATAKVQPKTPESSFDPPEPQQKHEQPTETIARRVVEDLAQAGPLDPDQRPKARTIVHFAYGSLWGCAYGLVRESLPGLASGGGILAWGTTVWMLSDNLILPAFKLSPSATEIPGKVHAYAWAAHLAYAATVVGSYELLRHRPALLALGALRMRRRLAWLPEPARAPAKKIGVKLWEVGRKLPFVVEDRA
jgi:uncharacterized membrane protein YagU involved in acid resistance